MKLINGEIGNVHKDGVHSDQNRWRDEESLRVVLEFEEVYVACLADLLDLPDTTPNISNGHHGEENQVEYKGSYIDRKVFILIDNESLCDWSKNGG